MEDRKQKEVSQEFVWLAGTIYRILSQSLPKYANKYSPKKFTCAQIQTLIDLQKLLQLENSFSGMEPDVARGFSFRGKSAEEWIQLLHNVGAEGPSSFRGIVRLVRQSPELRHVLELKSAPHYSTLFRAAAHSQASQQKSNGV